MTRSLVLASTSRYRRELFDRLRLPYRAVAPPFPEEVDANDDPVAQIEAFAVGKARSVAPQHPDALIIGSDQGLVASADLGGQPHPRLLGKPGSPEGARSQLARLSGGVHRLVTAVCVLDAATGALELATEVHALAFRTLTEAQIEAYVALDNPVDCAGSFRLESLGVALFEHIDGNDPTGIIGLPLIRLVALLSRFGVEVLALPAAADPPSRAR